MKTTGCRMTPTQGVQLLKYGDVLDLGVAADVIRRRLYPENLVTFIIDRNINYTNVCKNECKFCAFYRRQDDSDAYLLGYDTILDKVGQAVQAGATQVMIQGGLHPELSLEYIEEMFRLIKQNYSVAIHSLTPAEVEYLAERAGLSITKTLERLKAAGLDSLPGGGAEILVDTIRQRVSPKKISADGWLSVMRQAHHIGLESTATMVIGFGESVEDRIQHFEKIRALQDETGGFRAFIMWSFQPGNTELGGEKISFWDYLKTLSVARIYLDNIAHIQGSWVTQGERIGQLTLAFGADDLGSIMLEENVVRAAGTSYQMSIDKMVKLIGETGHIPAQRDTEYKVLREWR